ncbi:MAG TPA: PHP domain-containing protein [Acidimicrobiales bacterium]|nr:PHP domain-containing protein [Acidimicrobiales bacterium]
MIDYHVHFWPHAQRASETDLDVERIAAYTELAARQGVREIALTEHFFRFTQGRALVEGWWDDLSLGGGPALRDEVRAYFDHHATADLDRYVEAALAAQQADLPVVIGLEVDYYPGRMEAVAALLSGYPFDVLLGSVHWIGNWMFDDLASAIEMAEWDRRGVRESWTAYTEALEELAATRACDVLAHPDLVKVAGHRPDPGVVTSCEDRIAAAAAASGMAAEVSSAGMVKPCREDYPSPSLLRRFAELKVPVTFASDTHGTARVAERNHELVAAALAAGHRSVRRFRRRQPHDDAIEAVAS